MIRANFKIAKTDNKEIVLNENNENNETEKKQVTKEEFENYMLKTGAAGSFMIFRSEKKDDELGLEEL